MDVEANANDSGYQLWQGMLAFGVGGVEGVGLGLGRQQVHFLPEAHTDFIFPVIGEELGLFCTLLIVVLFLFLFLGSYWKLRNAPRVFEYQLALGAVLFISLQAIINIGCGHLSVAHQRHVFTLYQLWWIQLVVTLFSSVGLLMFLGSGKVRRVCSLESYEKDCDRMWGYGWTFDTGNRTFPKFVRAGRRVLALYQ